MRESFTLRQYRDPRQTVLEVVQYIEELQSIVDECDRPREDSDKCIQCDEKQRFIRRMLEILN